MPDPALEVLVKELRGAKNTAEFLAGVYGVLKPALLASYEALRAAAHPIADQPTRRLLGFVIEEKNAQLEWGRAALAALVPSPSATKEWEDRLKAFLTAAGGVDGTATRGEPPTVLREEKRVQACAGSPARCEIFARMELAWRGSFTGESGA